MNTDLLAAPLLVFALTSTATLASADTIVVDDDDGPGVDFSDLAEAIAAAADGDVLLVLAGQYGNFFVDGKGLTLVGEAGVVLGGDCIVSDIAADQVFSISSVENLSIWFDDCDGVVVLDNVTMAATCCSSPLIATGCADLRVQLSKIVGAGSDATVPAVELQDSRAEFSGCSLRGQLGRTSGSNQDGAPALQLGNSRVHLAQTRTTGGSGAITTDCAYGGGWAGAGVRVSGSGSDLVVAGPPRTLITGGDGGASPGNGCDGLGASAVSGAGPGSTLRASGVQLLGGGNPAGVIAPPLDFGGAVELPDERDPTLELRSTPEPGQPLRLRVSGEPFSSVRLMIGRNADRAGDPSSAIEQLTSGERTLTLGSLDASGELARTFTMPSTFSPGTTIWLQAATISPAGNFERSNSALLILR